MPEFVYEGPDISHLDDFTHGYIEAMYFTDSGGIDDELEPDSELGEDTLRQIIDDCFDFKQQNEANLQRAYDAFDYTPRQAGIDFWFTRNRHGAGFWDRGLEDIGDVLTARAHAFGEVWPYLGDDGKVYL